MIKCGGRITKNFRLEEIANPLSKETVELEITPELILFIQRCQVARETLAQMVPSVYSVKGFIVNSCYRTAKYNAKVGGDKNSAHLVGRAMDIGNIRQSDFKLLTNVWETICVRDKVIGGINYYNWGVHITDNEDRFGNFEFTIRDKRGK